MYIYECPYCKNHMEKLEDICPNCGAQNGEFARIYLPDDEVERNRRLSERPQTNGNIGADYGQEGYGEPLGGKPITKETYQKRREAQYAAIAFALGLLSLPADCMGMGIVLAIPALIFGILGIRGDQKVFSIIGIFLGLAGGAFSVLILIAAVMQM
ncbi:MAG: hypothetical protein ACI4ES_11900 [Roseburia sp.]